jgi:hypothetical protein
MQEASGGECGFSAGSSDVEADCGGFIWKEDLHSLKVNEESQEMDSAEIP